MKFILVAALIGVAVFAQVGLAQSQTTVEAVIAELNSVAAVVDPTSAARLTACAQSLKPYGSISNPVVSQFRAAGLVPRFLDAAPTEIVQAKWTTVGGAEALLGNSLTISQINDIPQLTWNCNATDNTAYYTVAFFDCDPLGDNDLLRSVQYHVIGNIPNCDLYQGTNVTHWLHPTPTFTGVDHRYVVLVWKQYGVVTFEEPTILGDSFAGRLFWCPRTFANKYNLGSLVGGNFIKLQYDSTFNTNVNLINAASFSNYVVNAMGRANLPAPPSSG